MSESADSFRPSTYTDIPLPDENQEQGEKYHLDAHINTTTESNVFTYDIDKQHDLDPKRVAKAENGVKEIYQDAMVRILKQSEKIKGDARQTGYEEGFKEGFQKGEEEAKKEFIPFLASQKQIIEEVSGLRKTTFQKMEREMIEMIVALTKRVIRFEISKNEECVKDVIRLAVQSILDRETLTIQVHPQDKKYAEEYDPELKKIFADIHNLHFKENSSIERGGCIIQTNFGTIDARLDTLTDQIENILNHAPPISSEKNPEQQS